MIHENVFLQKIKEGTSSEALYSVSPFEEGNSGSVSNKKKTQFIF